MEIYDPQALLDLIKRRRTHRSYLPGKVPAEQVQLLLEALRWAPSAANSQPWELILIDDPEVKARLRAAFLRDAEGRDPHFRGVSEKQADLLEDPLLVAVCGDRTSMQTYIDQAEIPEARKEELFLLTIGAAVENLLLQATALGLATVWLVRIARVPEVRKILRLPERLRLLSFVAVGYGAREPFSRNNLRIPIEEKTHHNRYGQPWSVQAESGGS